MQKQKKAFTLVELIVVVVILSILGTVGYVSFSGYSLDSRNTVRKQAILSLDKLLTIEATKGKNLFNYVDSGSEISDAEISGALASTGVNYKAGPLNALNLQVPADDYTDPVTGELYKIGVTSTGSGYRFQAGTPLEPFDSGINFVSGNYVPRSSIPVVGSGVSGEDTYRFTNTSDIGLLKRGDYIVGDGIPAGTFIEKVEEQTIYLSQALTDSNTELFLASPEVTGLIFGENLGGTGWVPTPSSCSFDTGVFDTCTFG